jgi:transposase-like protein
MSQDDVLFGYRLQLFDLAGRIGVSAACRSIGIHRSTYYRWRAQVERHGLEVLRLRSAIGAPFRAVGVGRLSEASPPPPPGLASGSERSRTGGAGARAVEVRSPRCVVPRGRACQRARRPRGLRSRDQRLRHEPAALPG